MSVPMSVWKTRIRFYGGRSEQETDRLVQELRKSSQLKVQRRHIEIIAIRRLPTRYALDPLSAQIAAVTQLYDEWPEGWTLPSGIRTTTTWEAE